MSRGASLLVALSLLVASPATAQGGTGGSPSDVAIDIAYNFCPSYIFNRRSIATDAYLKERGFTPQPAPRGVFPGYESAGLQKGGDRIVVSGYSRLNCSVSVEGPSAAAMVRNWQAQLNKISPGFTLDKERSGKVMFQDTFFWTARLANGRTVLVTLSSRQGKETGRITSAEFQIQLED